ncbi:MAG: M23 family metallopeptidase [Cyanobacteria bacterium J06639_18]
MTASNRLLFPCSLFTTLAVVLMVPKTVISQTSTKSCPTPALERFVRHRVTSGETLEKIAQKYNLESATIIRMNRSLTNQEVSVGQEILIPPYNGVIVELSPTQSLKQVAAQYKVRADVLFEINGCLKNPSIVFVPQLGKSVNPPAKQSNPTSPQQPVIPEQVAGYPLPSPAQVIYPFGWQMNQATKEVFFHSGVDLSAAIGTNVQAIDSGTVVFAGEQGSYGNLIVIYHESGLQSRYAHLGSISVAVGQSVKTGDVLGKVGSSGIPSISEPHLHFEIRSSSDLGWVAKNPQSYLQQ